MIDLTDCDAGTTSNKGKAIIPWLFLYLLDMRFLG
jgi:hypothetical protein